MSLAKSRSPIREGKLISKSRLLFRAVSDGDIKRVRELIAEGADVDAPSERGQTALMIAAVFGHEEIAGLLLTAGADTSLKDTLGFNASDWSERRGFPNIARLISRAPKAVATARAKGTAVGDNPHDSTATAVTESNSPRAPVSAGETVSGTSSTPPVAAATQPSSLLSQLRARAAQARTEAQYEESAQPATVSLAAPAGAAQTSSLDRKVSAPLQLEKEPEPVVFSEPQSAPVMPEALTTDPTSAEQVQISDRFQRVHQATGPLNLSSAEFHPSSVYTQPSSRRLMLGVIIAVTFLGTVFLTYRLVGHQSVNTTAAPPPVTRTEPLKPPVTKPLPIVGGALRGAELSVPDAQLAAAADKSSSGIVNVQVQVNRRGKVVSIHVLDGDLSLRGAATKAAHEATFAPDKLPGKNSIVTGTISYSFGPVPAILATSVSPAKNSSTTTSENADGDYAPITGGDLSGIEQNLPQAEYPENLKKKGISGTIVVTVRVNETGKVISWRSSAGDPQLRKAALAAAKKATFNPDKLHGKREVVGTITYNFKS